VDTVRDEIKVRVTHGSLLHGGYLSSL